jgi:hypothetical protein
VDSYFSPQRGLYGSRSSFKKFSRSLFLCNWLSCILCPNSLHQKEFYCWSPISRHTFLIPLIYHILRIVSPSPRHRQSSLANDNEFRYKSLRIMPAPSEAREGPQARWLYPAAATLATIHRGARLCEAFAEVDPEPSAWTDLLSVSIKLKFNRKRHIWATSRRRLGLERTERSLYPISGTANDAVPLAARCV